MSTALLALLVACVSEDANPDVAADVPAEPSDAGLLLVDMDDLTVRWTASPGWAIGPTTVLGDVTGDGTADAITYAGAIGEASRALLVAGPLRRSLTLPGDELASFIGAGDVTAGDVTGDGVPELRLTAFPSATGDRYPYLLEGPFAGEMDPTAVGIVAGEGDKHLDLDGDGVLDLVTMSYQQLGITWGPLSRWTGPTDLVLELSCGDANGFTYPEIEAFPDMDGDGRREISVQDGDNYCAPLWFPLPSTGGTFDPIADPDTVTGIAELQAIPDQSGDGTKDVWLWQTRVVMAAPVVFATGDVTATETITADPGLTLIHPTQYDLDADGLGDFIALDVEVDASEVQSSTGSPPDPVTGEVLVLVAGGTDLASPTYGMAWDIEGSYFDADDVFAEAGVVSVLVTHPTEGVIVVDLGPGSAL